MDYLIPGFSAFVIAFLLLLTVLKIFPKLGLLDRPEKYGLKRKPIPYPGGVMLFVSFLILSLLFLELNGKLIGLLIGGGLLTAVSFIDDRKGLSAWLRLGVQISVGIIVVFAGIGIEGITNPLGGYLRLDHAEWILRIGEWQYPIMIFSAIFTVIWTVLLINTMNWLDGIPGLVSGISTLGGITLFFLSISDLVNQPDVATMALIIGMIAFAFWLFDFYPPKMIIGDSGSMFLGFMLAMLAIFSSGKIATTFLILGFAILDALYVIVKRLAKKQAPWKGGEWDKYRHAIHLHHRMLKAGFSERQVLVIIYLLSAIFGVTALLVGTKGKFWAIVVLGVVSFVLGLLLKFKRKS